MARLSPDELDQFPATSRAFFRASARLRPFKWQRATDDMLGFGGGDVTAISPASLRVVAAVVHRLAKMGKPTRAAFRRYRDPADESPPRLSAEDIGALRDEAAGTCTRLGVPAATASGLVDALVASLDGPTAAA